MQNLTINGHIGRDAAVKETTSGQRFIAFTVAVNSRIRNAEKTTWYDVISFNVERYKNMVQYLKKGTGVVVNGELDASVQTGNDGVARLRVSIAADNIDFAGSSVSGATSDTQTTSPVAETVAEPEVKKKVSKKPVEETVSDAPSSTSDDDELPF